MRGGFGDFLVIESIWFLWYFFLLSLLSPLPLAVREIYSCLGRQIGSASLNFIMPALNDCLIWCLLEIFTFLLQALASVLFSAWLRMVSDRSGL